MTTVTLEYACREPILSKDAEEQADVENQTVRNAVSRGEILRFKEAWSGINNKTNGNFLLATSAIARKLVLGEKVVFGETEFKLVMLGNKLFCLAGTENMTTEQENQFKHARQLALLSTVVGRTKGRMAYVVEDPFEIICTPLNAKTMKLLEAAKLEHQAPDDQDLLEQERTQGAVPLVNTVDNEEPNMANAHKSQTPENDPNTATAAQVLAEQEQQVIDTTAVVPLASGVPAGVAEQMQQFQETHGLAHTEAPDGVYAEDRPAYIPES